MFRKISEKLQEVLQHQEFMKYFKNTSWLFVEKILRIIATLFVGALVARYLGPAKFGILSYAQSVVGLLVIFTTLGMDGIIVRELVIDKQNNQKKLIGTAFWLRVIASMAVVLFLFLIIKLGLLNKDEGILIIIIASSLVFRSVNVIDFYFQSKVLSKYVVYANSISLAVSSIIKIILVLSNASLIAFAFMAIVDSVVLMFGLVYFYIKYANHIGYWQLKLSIVGKLFKDSWPIMLSGVFIAVYMRIDQVMIKIILGAEAVGQYTVAVNLSEAWYFVPIVIATSLFPAILIVKNDKKNI